MISKIVVPNLGTTGSDVTLVGWLVKPGDHVKAGASLFSVSTYKAEVEVEAFRDGYVRELLAQPGSSLALGTEVAILSGSMEEPLPTARHGNQSSRVDLEGTKSRNRANQE